MRILAPPSNFLKKILVDHSPDSGQDCIKELGWAASLVDSNFRPMLVIVCAAVWTFLHFLGLTHWAHVSFSFIFSFNCYLSYSKYYATEKGGFELIFPSQLIVLLPENFFFGSHDVPVILFSFQKI